MENSIKRTSLKLSPGMWPIALSLRTAFWQDFSVYRSLQMQLFFLRSLYCCHVSKAERGGRELEIRKNLSTGSAGFYLPLVKKFNPWVRTTLFFKAVSVWVLRGILQHPIPHVQPESARTEQRQGACSMQAARGVVWSRGEVQWGPV